MRVSSGWNVRWAAPIAAFMILALAGTARAQTPVAEAGAGPVVEKMQSGVVLVPDVSLTEVDGEFGSLAGLQIGGLVDDRLFIGGGIRWLANGSSTRKMTYGGLAVDWALARSRRLGLSLGALVGGGTSTLGIEVAGHPWRGGFPDRHRHGYGDVPPSEPTTFLVPAGQGYFVAEPRASASLMLTRWLRVGAGVSYRLLAGAGSFNDRLRGVSGTVSVQLGSF